MLKKLMNMKKKKGFTLIELIVVLVIMAILAAAAIPTMMGYVDKARASQYLAEGRAVYVAAQAGATEGYGKAGATTQVTKVVGKTIAAGTDVSTDGVSADVRMPLFVEAAVQDVCRDSNMQGGQFAVEIDKNGEVTMVEYVTKDQSYLIRITPHNATKDGDSETVKIENKSNIPWTITKT